MRRAALLLAGLALLVAGWGTSAVPASAQPTPSPTPQAVPTTGPDQPASVTQVQPPSPDPLLGADPESAANASPPALHGPDAADPTTPAAAPPSEPASAGQPGTPADPAGQVDDADAARIVGDIEGEAEAPPVDVLVSLLGSPAGSRRWSNYELGTDLGLLGFDQLLSAWARMIFAVGKLGVLFAAWVLEFVLQFDLGRHLADQLGALTARYADVVHADLDDGGGDVSLRGLVLLIAVAHAGWQILRHRAHAAVPELLVTALIASLGGFLLLTADSVACRGLSVMADLTTGTLDLADPAADADAVLRSPPRDWCRSETTAEGGDRVPTGSLPGSVVAESLIADAFVHEPYLLLQWGVVPEEGTSCRRVADALVQARAWGDDDYPRDRMAEAGCDGMVAFNEGLGATRVAAAGAYALGALAFALAVLLTAGTLLVAQVAGAVLVLVMPFAVVIGIAPGAGRDLLARWGHSVLKVAVLFVGSGFFLAVLTIGVSAVQSSTDDSVLVQMLASTAVAWSLVLLRGRVIGSMRFAAHAVGRHASGGRDVGGVGRGPARAAVATAFQAADVAATVHAGAAAGTAVALGAAQVASGSMMSAGVSRGLAVRHRARAIGGPAAHPTRTPGRPARGRSATAAGST